MASGYDDLPIVFAEDAETGELRHVDDVKRGLACGCVCPACGQRLVARQGEKNAHSFAHRSGECRWAAEHVITALSKRAIEERGSLALPPLSYPDACEGRDVEISPARTMRVVSVVTTDASGRGAPDLLVTVSGGGSEATFAVLSCLTHGATDAQLDSLFEGMGGVVEMDYAADMRERRRGLGRHYDRDELAMAYQDPGLIAGALLDESYPFKSWVRNRRAEEAARESVARHNEDMERRMKERVAREREVEERRKAEEEERARRERERQAPSIESESIAYAGASLSTPSRQMKAPTGHSLPDVAIQAPSARRYDVMQWKICGKEHGSWYVSNGDMDAMVTESGDGWCYDMVVDLDAEVLREVLSHLGELVHGCVDFTLCVSASGARYAGKLAVSDGTASPVTVRMESGDAAGALITLSELLSLNVKLSMTYRDSWGNAVGRRMVSIDVESRWIILSRDMLEVY